MTMKFITLVSTLGLLAACANESTLGKASAIIDGRIYVPVKTEVTTLWLSTSRMDLLNCLPNKTGCFAEDSVNNTGPGPILALFPGVGTATVVAGGYMGGQALRRPTKINSPTTMTQNGPQNSPTTAATGPSTSSNGPVTATTGPITGNNNPSFAPSTTVRGIGNNNGNPNIGVNPNIVAIDAGSRSSADGNINTGGIVNR